MFDTAIPLPAPYEEYSYTIDPIDKSIVLFDKSNAPLSYTYKDGYSIYNKEGKKERMSQKKLKRIVFPTIDEHISTAKHLTQQELWLEQVKSDLDTGGPYLPTPLMPGFWVNRHGVVKTSTKRFMKPSSLLELRDGRPPFIDYALQYFVDYNKPEYFATPTIKMWNMHIANTAFSDWYVSLLSQNVGYEGSDLNELEVFVAEYLKDIHKSPKKAMRSMWEDMFGPLYGTLEEGKRFKNRLVNKTKKEKQNGSTK